MLVKAFGPPQVLAEALTGINDIDAAHIHGSWSAAIVGVDASAGRHVEDIDVLVQLM